MGRTEEVVRKTLAAVEASLYDIGILTDRGMFPRMEAINASQRINRCVFSSTAIANGAHIYFHPSGERRFPLLDDLDRVTPGTLTAHGFSVAVSDRVYIGFQFQLWVEPAAHRAGSVPRRSS